MDNFSKSSFSRYIENGIFEFGPLDFPRIVKYKKRKNSNKRGTRKEREILINRTYTDFIKFISNNPALNIVEMDTVVGLQEETDCFLTFNEVTIMFELLQNLISLDVYKNLFQVILTDNGHEFFDVNNI